MLFLIIISDSNVRFESIIVYTVIEVRVSYFIKAIILHFAFQMRKHAYGCAWKNGSL